MSNDVKKLKPAAARLLLANLAAQPSDTYDKIVASSGIAECRTLASAVEQLQELGFLVPVSNGSQHIVLRPPAQTAQPQEQTTSSSFGSISYKAVVSKLTKARS